MSDEFLPPRAGEDGEIYITPGEKAEVPIRVTIHGKVFNLSPSEALTLAGTITGTVSAWMALNGK